MYIVREEDRAGGEVGQVPLPELRRRHHLAVREVPAIRPGVPLPQMRLYGTVTDI